MTDSNADHRSAGTDGSVTDVAARRRNPRSRLLTATVGAVAVATLLLLTLFVGGSDDPAPVGAEPAEILALAFTTTEGGTATLADYDGRPLVVNFFASWCPPCRAELPDLEAVHQQLGDEVILLGVNQDFTEETWKAFVDESSITFETVFQPNSEIWSELGTQAMPTTALISPDGEVVRLWAGVLTDDKLIELIDEHLLEQT